MLLKKNRLNKEKDFLKLLRRGQTYFSPNFILKIIPNKLSDSRFGFIITKKNAKKAVLRNKIKRRLREVVRKDIIGAINKGFDLCFLIKKEVDLNKIQYEQLRREILILVKKTGILIE